jgi:N-methylhydantoinase A/oxoprolinase/acetone carboxylase beta subunit
MKAHHLVAVDIGGTFTDMVLMDVMSGESRVTKVLTSPSAPVECVRTGMAELLVAAGLSGSDLESVVHATTLATNIVTEGKGSLVAMLTTEGFRDVIETGHEGRYDGYDLQIVIPPALVERRHRLEVKERLDHTGEVVTQLEQGEIDRVVRDVSAGHYDAVAVCLLHSYANPDHEQKIGQALTQALPDTPVSLSSDVLPKQGEFERFEATVINSYVRPRIQAYLDELEEYCRSIGLEGPLFLMMSNGGMSGVDVAARLPVRMIESGPAAGVIGAARLAEELSFEQALSFDMGGTTAKACLIEDYHPRLSASLEVARLKRFASGSGYPVALPSIDLLEIGAGGGSIARINELGLLEVGPDSAGADPGPACYGRGGTLPTVTDADLLIGLLNPDYFLGGRMNVDKHAAEAAIHTHLSAQLDQEPLNCAWGVFDVVNENMARALRIHAVEQGVDPRTTTMIAFGGAGPVHACAVADKLGIGHIVCPDGAGVGSAYGLALAPRVSEEVLTRVIPVGKIEQSTVDELFGRLVDRARGETSATSVRYVVDLRLTDQFYEISVSLDGRLGVPTIDVADLASTFLAEYERRFEQAPSFEQIEIVNWRVQVSLPGGSVPASGARPSATFDGGEVGESLKGSRDVFLGPLGTQSASVWSRYALKPREVVRGPAIVEERESTVVVLPDFVAHVDEARNLHIRHVSREQSDAAAAAREGAL